MSKNKVNLEGRLGQNPEVKFLPNGDAVMNLTLATDESYVNKDGKKVDVTEWHSLVCYRKIAEQIAEKHKKGDKIEIFGKLQTRDWMDKTHNDKRYKTEILVDKYVAVSVASANRTEPVQQAA
jgi:single-strand DNA-binding protein